MPRIEAIYEFTTPRGKPRIRKVRREGKTFAMQSAYPKEGGGFAWEPGITDAHIAWSLKALYRLPQVLEGTKNQVPVWWAEGEKDADSLVRAGVLGTSTWQGSNDLYRAQAAWLTKHGAPPEVYVLLDADRPGFWFGWQRVGHLRDLGVKKSSVTVLEPPLGHNDVTDTLSAGLGLSALRRVDLGRLRDVAHAYRPPRTTAEY